MNIVHYGSIRMRVVGSGNLKQELLSLDAVETQTLTPIPMTSNANRMVNTLSNFLQQRAQLKLITTEIDEVFQLDEIYIYVRPVFTSYPQ